MVETAMSGTSFSTTSSVLALPMPVRSFFQLTDLDGTERNYSGH